MFIEMKQLVDKLLVDPELTKEDKITLLSHKSDQFNRSIMNNIIHSDQLKELSSCIRYMDEQRDILKGTD